MDVLTVEHLTKKIGNKTILKDISLNLKRGQIVGLVGANGAGKTSLMKVILGYSIYQEGNFEVIENKHKKSNVGVHWSKIQEYIPLCQAMTILNY